jgi:hypothetical protein
MKNARVLDEGHENVTYFGGNDITDILMVVKHVVPGIYGTAPLNTSMETSNDKA